MGIDVGSVSAKIVLLDRQDRIAFSAYHRHRAETWSALCAILKDATRVLGDVPVIPMITGSAGMGVSPADVVMSDNICFPAKLVH